MIIKIKKNNDIKIIYIGYVNDNIRIFGIHFVRNNKNNCKIIYNSKEYVLKEYVKVIDTNYKHEFILTLRIINNITNMSYMFYEYDSLLSFPEESELLCSDITEISNINFELDSSSALFDEKKENKSNIFDDLNNMSISSLFFIKNRKFL